MPTDASPTSSPLTSPTLVRPPGAPPLQSEGAFPRLKTEHLSVHFEDRSALEDVSLSFDPGEIASLVGPNGAGKSTLLRCLAGMLPPTHGKVLLDGALVRGPNPRVAYVPQRSEVDWRFPISVLDVALMGRALRGNRLWPIPERERREGVSALAAVGMDRYASVQIGALSGGQQQRVFIARALLQQADVFLLDEPFAGVDVPTQSLVLNILGNLRAQGNTIVFATHDLAMAEQSTDVCVLLSRRIIASGPPATVLTVANLRGTFWGAALSPAAMAPSP